jgi:signal transduction histidine kinase/ActR/RegA family two-component response regulator
MIPPSSPADDTERLRLLQELQVLDTATDPGLAALARLASTQTGCPIGALTLIDTQRQWFKAVVGLDLRDAHRDDAFCSHTILGSDVFVVPDAHADGRFVHSALVAGGPKLRFYAGAPVRVANHAIGTLCCMDHQARELAEAARHALHDLAQLAGALLEARLAARRAAGADERWRLEAESAKSEFLSRMSHEMRTPLNAVIGFTQLLLSRSGAPDASEVRDYAEHVLRAGEHLLALTNDVLDLQHVEEGRAELDTADLPLDGLVAQVIQLLAAEAEQRGIGFDSHVPPEVAVRADPRRLRQVLANIASNAIKYNRPAGVVRFSVDPDAPPARVRLSIEDTGAGLKPAQLDRLFQPFERLGRETSTIEGTGLGLIIARSLTVAMGGTLQVASRAGVGTRVVVELPAAQQTPLPFAEPARAPAPPAAAAPALRMLYVEDNRINAILFEEALRLRDGVELRLAENGAEALEQVRDWTPDVLVLDAHLPGMDGFELLCALRRQPGLDAVPAFMCSADAMPDDVRRAAAAGFAGYWAKPINIAKIMDDLDRLCAGLPPSPDAP